MAEIRELKEELSKSKTETAIALATEEKKLRWVLGVFFSFFLGNRTPGINAVEFTTPQLQFHRASTGHKRARSTASSHSGTSRCEEMSRRLTRHGMSRPR